MAFIISDKSDSNLEQVVKDFCDQKISTYCKPTQFIVVDKFPYTAHNKVDLLL